MSGAPAPHAEDASILELLPLPKTSTLSDAQRRGVSCVWCGIVLTSKTARGLGQRPAPGGGVFFPRGCPSCVRSEAAHVYTVHSRSWCPRCTSSRTECGTRRGLERVSREGL